jgi:hypothetical protein
MFYSNERDVPPQYRGLTRLLGMLSRVHGVNEELLDDIRAQIEQNEYLTEDKLNEAIHRLLREIMADEERVS